MPSGVPYMSGMSASITIEDGGELPSKIPIFPLKGVLLLPGGQLPLHIFEDRYKAMVNDALQSARIIGIIQSKDERGDLYNIGCAGRIQAFEETNDGRFYLTLGGVSRFRVEQELLPDNGYRRVEADYSEYACDQNRSDCLDLDRDRLNMLLGDYFSKQEMSCDWDAVMQASDQKLITCLSMICPFDPGEKQALLEAEGCHNRAEIFMTMLEMAVKNCHGSACH